jgi:hypothetical protein
MRVAVDQDFKADVDQPEFRSTDWLTLGGGNYAVAQLDVINAVLQAAHLQDDLAAAPAPESPVEVPALVESGMSIIHGDLGDVLRGRLERQRAVESGIDGFITGQAQPPPRLMAEDITLGYRYDVEDQSVPGFRSLHDRQVPAGYVFPRDEKLLVEPPPDEGWGSIALFTDGIEATVGQGTDVRYQTEGPRPIPKSESRDETAWRVDDHVMTWGGWSLSTPRVGASTTGSGEVKPREPNKPADDSPTQLIVDYAHINGTLPKLRYGRSYRFRARCVDLAGNGAQLGDTPPANGESPVVPYGRLAPLTAPLVIRRESRPDPGVGDLADVIVIKSELEQADADTPSADRLLFPPRVSQSRLERHDLPNGGNDPAAYRDLAERDALSIADQTLEDPETGELVAGGALGDDGQVTPGPTQPPVGYIPDPVARSVAFHGLPGTDPAAAPLQLSYGTWPTFAALQLELGAGDGAPSPAPARRRMRVELPKGTIVAAELSHAPDKALLGHMALAQGLDDPTDTLNGLNLSISGRRPITFVHAVRLPLEPPAFDEEIAFSRNKVGQTHVGINGRLGLHRATTEHVVLRARWTDTVDTPGTEAPVEQPNRRIVKDLQVALHGVPDTELVDLRLDLGDTKRRLVDLGAEAFCRFSRYFTERIDFVAAESGALALDPNGVAVQTVVLTNKETGQVFERGVHYAVDRELGELTILDGTAIPAGTVCRVEFIPLPVSRLSIEAPAGGRIFRFDVPSSAAPAAPRVLAALPAFKRTVTITDERITARHDGRVVRLHLDRPWFTSGRGELLGVAVDLDSTAPPALTRWGRDPITAGPGAPVQPTLDDFPAAVERAQAVDGRFDVAAHDVVFDEDRRFWVADVALDATFGYRPFAVLHVCRYQPLALDGQHLSPVVELDPIRLGASRRVTVTRLADGTARVRLTGNDNVNTVSVTRQEADAAIADPDLKWHDVESIVLDRQGTTANATHSGVIDLPVTGNERRLLIEDAEPVMVEDPGSGALVPSTVVAYREVIDIPAEW